MPPYTTNALPLLSQIMNLRISTLLALFLLSATPTIAQISWDGGAGDGLWSSPLNWSTNTVPGDNDDVEIIGSFTVTVNATDSCRSLVLQSEDANNRTATLNVTSGARLGVGQSVAMNDRNRSGNRANLNISGGSAMIVGTNLTMLKDASSQNDNDMLITLSDDNSLLKIDGDLIMTFTSQSGGNDFGVTMNEDSRLEANNITITQSGNNNTKDLFDLNQGGTSGDAAVVEVTSNVTIATSGTSIDCEFDLDFSARFEVGNNFTYTSEGNLVQFLLDRDAQFIVGNDMSITKGGNNDLHLFLNQNNDGDLADAQLTVGNNLNITKTDGDELEIRLSNNADIVVGNDIVISTNNADDDADNFTMLVQDDAKIDVTRHLDITMSDGKNIDLLIDIFGNGEIETGGNVDIDLVNADRTDIDVRDNGVLDVDGDFIFANTASSSFFELNGEDDASMTIDGSCTITNNHSSLMAIRLDHNASMDVATNLTLVRNNNSNLLLHLNQSADGAGADAQLHVGGNLTLDKNDGDEIQVYLNNDADIDVDGDLIVDVLNTDDDADFITVDLNDESGLNVDGSIDITRNIGKNASLNFLVSDDATMVVDGNLTVADNGGVNNMTLSNNAVVTISGNWTSTMTGTTGNNIRLSDQADLNLTGTYSLSQDANCSGNFVIDMDHTSTMDFGSAMTIVNNGSSGETFFFDRDAAFNLAGNFSLTHTSNGLHYTYLNQNDDGSAADAQWNIGGSYSMVKTDGDQVEFYLSNNADFTVANGFSISTSNTDDDADYVRIQMDGDAGFNVTGNATFTLADSRNTDFVCLLEGDALMNVTQDVVFSHTGGAATWTMNDNARFDIAGDWTNNMDNGLGYLVAMNNNADLNLTGAFTFNKTTNTGGLFQFDLDNEGNFSIGEELYMQNDGSGGTFIAMDGDAVLTVGDTMYWEHGNNGSMRVYLNETSAGTGADAQFTVNGNSRILKDDGDQVQVLMNQDADWTVNGDFTLSTSNMDDDGDFIQFDLDDNAGFTTTGSLFLNLADARNVDFTWNISNDALTTIQQNVSFSHTGANATWLLENNGRLDVLGDWSNVMDNANNFEVDMTNNADLNLTGAFNFLKTTAINGAFQVDLDNDGNFSIGQEMFVRNDGGGGTNFYMDGDAVLTVGDTLYLEHGTNGAFRIHLNETSAGTGADAQFTVNGNVRILKDNGDEVEIWMDQDADWIINGDLNFSMSNTDDNNDHSNWDLAGNSRWDTNGDFNWSISEPRNINLNFSIAGTATFDVQNNWTITQDNAQTMFIDMIEGGNMIIGGDFSMANNGTSESFLWEMDSVSTATVGGNLMVDGDANGTIRFALDRDASLSVTGNMELDETRNASMRILLNQTADGSAADAQLSVGGNFDIDKSDGDQLEVLLSNDADLNVAGNFDISNSNIDDNDDNLTITVSDQAAIDVDNDFLIAMSDNGEADVLITAQTGGSIDVARDMTIALTDADATLFTISGSSQFAIGRDLTYTNDVSSYAFTVDLDDTGVMTVGGDVSVTNLSTANTPTSTEFLLDGDASMSITGNLDIVHNGNDHVEIFLNQAVDGSAADAQLSIGGNFTVDKDQGDNLHLFLSNDADLSVGGNLSFDYGDTELSNDEFAVVLNNNAGVAVDGSATFLYNNSTGGTVLDMRFVLNDNSTFAVGPAAGPYTSESFTIEMRNGADTDIDLNGDALLRVYGDLNLIKSGGNDFLVNLNSGSGTGAEIEVFNDFDLDNTENADNLFVQVNQSAVLDVENDIDLRGAASAGMVEIELNSSSKIEIAGDFLRNASPNDFGMLDGNGSSTVEYDGSVQTQTFAQDAGAGADEFDYQNVVINNSFGTSPQITMEGDVIVHSSILWTDGVVSSTTSELLRVDDNATSSGASDASHIDGPIEKIGNDAFSFPTGNEGNWRQIDISAPALSTDVFRAQFTNDSASNYGYSLAALGPGVDHVSSCFFWDLERINGSSDVDVTLSWEFCEVTDLGSLLVTRWDGSAWQSEGNGGTTGGVSPAFGTVVSAANVSNFGLPFTLGSSNSNNPLPIELISFDARLNGDQVDLTWSTAVEIDNERFIIERSADGVNFQPILEQPGAGNSQQVIDYSDVDFSPLLGQGYYRLRQIDFDGTYSYSAVRSVFYQPVNTSVAVTVFPNPVTEGALNIRLTGVASDTEVLFTDALGRPVTRRFIAANGQPNQLLELVLAQELATGIYFVVVTNGEQTITEKVILR